ncbi:unnamed protein product [Tetraodon nigroviridis]|uniref:(spotted green pufferfish) hypothetical protein n=1 Tax=Tetraodon nigroviridis TaxID=99883 RepID=Q4SIF3_TETNG|nr:unnamed protein product [Tetraodon nigroviridis]
MSELFMECVEEELEPWQKQVPQIHLIEDDDDEPIFVGVLWLYCRFSTTLKYHWADWPPGVPVPPWDQVCNCSRPQVQQITKNVVTLSNVQSPVVFSTHSNLSQPNSSNSQSLQTISVSAVSNSSTKGKNILYYPTCDQPHPALLMSFFTI